MNKYRIKLKVALPIADKHGAGKGKIFEAFKKPEDTKGIWFIGADGTECKAMPGEYEILEFHDASIPDEPMRIPRLTTRRFQ